MTTTGRQLVLLSLDDDGGFAGDSMFRNAESAELKAAQFYTYDTVHEMIEDIEDDWAFDAVFIDLVLVHGDCGLVAIEWLAERRPKTPVIVRSALEDGDRFLYALAAANWYPNVKAVVPKVQDKAALAQDTLRALNGQLNYLVGELRNEQVANNFCELLAPESWVRWDAIRRSDMQKEAATKAGVSAALWRKWERRQLETVNFLWSMLAERTMATGIVRHEPDERPDRGAEEVGDCIMFEPVDGKTHEILRRFVDKQEEFFRDPYIKERMTARD